MTLRPTRGLFVVSLVALAALAVQCGKGSPTAPTPPGTVIPIPGARTSILIGAGDIGECGSPGTIATGRLIEATLGEVFLAGDIAYNQGTMAQFQNCFEPYWGHARDRWRPVPGNHEYESQNAAPYFQFFGPSSGPRSVGYYRFQSGEWLVLMLNSNIDVSLGSDQYEFARASLQEFRGPCQMAMWHHPLFSSGPNGDNRYMREMFRLMYANRVDVVVNAHDHLYERFSRQDADGAVDPNGVRQFIVGTGGAPLYRVARIAPNSGPRIVAFGIMRFTLRPDAYDWEFLETTGSLGDNGSTPCH